MRTPAHVLRRHLLGVVLLSFLMNMPRPTMAFRWNYDQLAMQPGSAREQLFTSFGTTSTAPSWFNLSLEVIRERAFQADGEGFIEVVLLQRPDIRSLQNGISHIKGLTMFCCTQELLRANTSGCDAVGTLMVQPPPHKLRRFRVHVAEGVASTKTQHNVPLDATDVYAAIVSHCDHANVGSLVVNGAAVVSSASSPLPIHEFYVFKFYRYWLVLMLLLLLVWLATNATNLFLGRMSLFQHGVTVVLVLASVEAFVWYTSYVRYSSSGSSSTQLRCLSVIISVVSRSACLTLVATASCGHGITVPPLLRVDMKEIAASGGVFFLAQLLPTIDSVVSTTSTMFVHNLSPFLPLTLLDVIVTPMLFVPLGRMITQLKTRHQLVPLRVFHALLIVVGSISFYLVVVAAISIRLAETNATSEHFGWSWLFPEASLHIKNAALLLTLMLLWRPTPTMTTTTTTNAAEYDAVSLNNERDDLEMALRDRESGVQRRL